MPESSDTPDESRSSLDRIAERAGRLYTLPKVAVELLELSEQPRVDAAALTACIELDPAMVGKILRTVNSSLFGLGREITDLNQAVALLGIKPLKLLVLGFSLPPKLMSGSEQQALSRYWRHALVKAVAARQLAERQTGVDSDDAFLAGLLQDIGMLVLLKEIGEPYAQFLGRVHDERGKLLPLEFQTLGFDHQLLSGRMLSHWGLPEAFCRALAMQPNSHLREQLPPALQPLPRLLHGAEALALLLVDGRTDALAAVLSGDGGDQLEPWRILVAGLQEKVEELTGTFDLSLEGSEDYDAIFARAHEQLAAAAEVAVAERMGPADASTWSETGQLADAAQSLTRRAPPAAAPPADSSLAPAAAHSAPAASAMVAAAAATMAEDSGLLGHVAHAVADSRRRRVSLSLILVQLHDYEDLLFQAGEQRAEDEVQRLRRAMDELLLPDCLIASGDGQLAALVGDCERSQAVHLARRLVEATLHSPASAAAASAVALSIGIATVAMPAKNFPPGDLVEAAHRCLFGVEASGGNGVKSIDIY